MSDDCKAAMLEAGVPYPCAPDCSCALREENDVLRAENARLRESLSHYATDESPDGWVAIDALEQNRSD